MPPRWRNGFSTWVTTAERARPSRGPAARTGAAGPRRARSKIRRLRCCRGRRPGGAAGGRRPLAARRCSRGAARVADSDRRAPADRSAAKRAVAAEAGDPDGAAGAGSGEVSDQDDTLIVLFMCCHPALTPASAIALTLRAVGGLTTAEIANAFLVPEATMAQRIARAKQRIKASGVPFQMPTHERTDGQVAHGAACAVPHLQRGVCRKQRPRAAPHRVVGRGDPTDQDGAATASRRR